MSIEKAGDGSGDVVDAVPLVEKDRLRELVERDVRGLRRRIRVIKRDVMLWGNVPTCVLCFDVTGD